MEEPSSFSEHHEKNEDLCAKNVSKASVARLSACPNYFVVRYYYTSTVVSNIGKGV
jgi:hypothetical protein